MINQDTVSYNNPEIEFDYGSSYPRSFMSERCKIYHDAINSLIVDRALTKFLGESWETTESESEMD
jgi:hypothetical protein